jgi:prepilin-type N-terminal cleavage/methylation domain-containing protein
VTRNSQGFTLIELLIVVVIIGILVSIVVPKFANGKERAMIAAMKSDLHNLMSAEEAYYSNGLQYYNGVLPNAAFPYSVSSDVTITLQNVTNTGWGATASHSGSSKTCAIFVGTGGPIAPAVNEGEPNCTP